MSPDRILTFANFRLDPISGHLYRESEPVALAPKAFALLQYLARHAGRLVPKQELLSAVWPDVFVGDAVLKSTIREVARPSATIRPTRASSRPRIAAAIDSSRQRPSTPLPKTKT